MLIEFDTKIKNHHIMIELKNSLPYRLFEEFDRMKVDLESRVWINSEKKSFLDRVKNIF